jgi:Rap1a immunity proteins
MKRLLLALAFVGPAHAEFIDGNKLLSDMNGTHGTQMSALGYVMGVADALQGAVVCLPTNVTGGQIHDMIKNYLNNVPRDRNLSADSIVARVLKDVWPCASRPSNGRSM